MKCNICNADKYYKNRMSFAYHLKNEHGMYFPEYMLKYDYDSIPNCKCGKKVIFRSNGQLTKTCGNSVCVLLHTEEAKEKIRLHRFKYLTQKTGKTAWERRAAGEMSYLEQWFFDEIIIKYNLLEKYDIVNEYPFYPYNIDFAFLNIKLAVELDGACHFKNGNKRLDHDLKKDDFLLKAGWNIFRIAYKENNNEMIDKFLYSLEILSDAIDEKKLGSVLHRGTLKKLKPKRTKSQYFEELRLQIFNRNQKYIPLILNSNIDFSKIGWVTEVSKILGTNVQYVNKWMKKYMQNFYETQCYKRKNTTKN